MCRNDLKASALFLVAFGILGIGGSPSAWAQTTIHVDVDAEPGECSGASTVSDLNGSTWDCAYPALQDAFDQANNNAGTDYAIWIAEGTYYPDVDKVDNDGDGSTEHADGNPDESFTLTRDGVEVLGGFDGTETSRSARAPSTTPVTLSGDIGQDDDAFAPNSNTDNDDGTTPEQTDHIRNSNAHHVLVFDGTGSSDITSATLLDGVTVTGGQATGSGSNNGSGGGLFCNGDGSSAVCSPEINNVAFEGNLAGTYGGAVYLLGQNGGIVRPKIMESTFLGNSASSGGALLNFAIGGTASPTIRNTVTFSNNYASALGGAIDNSALSGGTASPQISDTDFLGNEAGSAGAIIVFSGGGTSEAKPTFTTVTFQDNVASGTGVGLAGSGKGGAIATSARQGATTNPSFSDSDFASNEAVRGGALYVEGIGSSSTASPTITNNTTFSTNMASSEGGAIFLLAAKGGTASPQIEGSSFSQNGASGPGGAIAVISDTTDGSGNPSTADPSIINGTTFMENTAGPNGGALFIHALEGGTTTPTFDDVDLSGASTTDEAGRGGAMFILSDTTDDAGTSSVADPVIKNSTFSGFSVGDRGGALFIAAQEGAEARPEVTDVTFSSNEADAGGGAVEVLGDDIDDGNTPGRANATFTDVRFRQNTSGNAGGALVARTKDGGAAQPSIVNAVFAGNSASVNGGALVNRSSGGGTARLTATNITAAGNEAGNAGDALFVSNGGGGSGGTAAPVLQNAILWNTTSSSDEVFVQSGTPSISYSIVEGGCSTGASCSGNLLDQNPQFAGENAGAGPDGTFGTSDDDLRVQGPGSGGGASPAIDAGDNSAISTSKGLGGNDRMIDVGSVDDDGNGTAPIVDMGAFESKGNALPVELASFDGTQINNGAVRLTWTTVSETNNAGFRMQHRRDNGEPEKWKNVGRVDGAGTSNRSRTYHYVVRDLSPGTHRFRLQQVDHDGTIHTHAPMTVDVGLTQPVRLWAPTPNPVRERATVSFAVRERMQSTLALYNVLGQRVATLYDEFPPAGNRQTIRVNTADLPSGVYILRLKAGPHTKVRRMTVVR